MNILTKINHFILGSPIVQLANTGVRHTDRDDKNGTKTCAHSCLC